MQGPPHRDYCRSDAEPLRKQGTGTSTASRCSSLQGWERSGLLPHDVQGTSCSEGSLLPRQHSIACCGEGPEAELGHDARQGSLQARVTALEARLAELACAPQDMQQLRQEVAGLHQAQLDMQARLPFYVLLGCHENARFWKPPVRDTVASLRVALCIFHGRGRCWPSWVRRAA